MMNSLVMLFGGMFVFFIIFTLALYVVAALAEMKALKILGYTNTWFAWIPFLNIYALVEVTGEESADIFGIRISTSVMKFYSLIAFGCTFVPVVGGIASFLINLLCGWWTYKYVYALLDGKTPDDESVIALLSALIGIIQIFKFFSAKPRQDGPSNYNYIEG